jgi:hypothetical protein
MKKLQYTTNDPSATTDYLAADNTWKTIPGGGGGGGIPHGDTSGTDTYTTTISGVTSLNDGDAFLIRFTTGNTTSATLNINSLGAIPLYRNNDGELIGGDIIDGAEMLCVYNSTTNRFQVIGTAPNTLLSYVTNAESTTITKGQAVYAFGGQGDRLKVKLAYNTSDATSAQTIGVVLSTSIGANQKGLIIMQGQIDGLNLFPTSTWADGDAVYLGATAGSFSKTKPLAPNHLVYLGFVTTASNGSAGRMYVRVQNGYELNEIHDVAISSPSNGQLLSYNLSSGLWENATVTQAPAKSFMNIIINASLLLSVTTYGTFGINSLITTETQRLFIVPQASTFSRLYVRITTNQVAGGSLVFTLRKNQVDTAIVATIAAGSAAGTEVSNTANTVSFSAGDDLSFKIQNNAGATSATIGNISIMAEV